MRIEIDEELLKLLDEIKRLEPTIYGRGHSETVRYLANYYRVHEPVEALIDDLKRLFQNYVELIDKKIEASIERAFLKAMQHVVTNIFSADENPPQNRSPGQLRRTENGG